MPTITLRPVRDDDVPVYFGQQTDPEACRMAAFTPALPDDPEAARAAFEARLARNLANPGAEMRTVVTTDAEGREQVAGSVLRYFDEGRPEVSYWIGREFWGQGIATAALALFLRDVVAAERPLYARAAADNAGSLRVLERNGFRRIGAARGYARAAEIDEVVLVLEGG